ncbi:MAG: hypothetical protein LBD41_02930, partial [Clostridiales Family XIII bacterium]|nr:hypothetical protein [Clostridiales Family XIII bacterium]
KKFFEKRIIEFAKFIKNKNLIPEEKYKKLEDDLIVSGINKSPEIYISELVLELLILLLGCIIISVFFTLFIFLSIFILIIVSFSYLKRPDKLAKANKNKIDKLLPKFADFIGISLKNTRDIYTILKAYIKTGNNALNDELKKTIADMKTSSIEKSLINLERRVKLKSLTEIIRAIIGITRGDTEINYFILLAYDLRQKEIYNLKKDALKRPTKITKYSILLLILFISSYFSVFIIYILEILKGVM